MVYANKKGADQPAHPRSLISTFVVRCLDSILSLVSILKISCLQLASVAEQTGLSFTWTETPKRFSRDVTRVCLPYQLNGSISKFRGVEYIFNY